MTPKELGEQLTGLARMGGPFLALADAVQDWIEYAEELERAGDKLAAMVPDVDAVDWRYARKGEPK